MRQLPLPSTRERQLPYRGISFLREDGAYRGIFFFLGIIFFFGRGGNPIFSSFLRYHRELSFGPPRPGWGRTPGTTEVELVPGGASSEKNLPHLGSKK